MNDAFKGIVNIEIGGKDYALSFTWGKLAKLRTRYGDDFDKQIVKATTTYDFDDLAEMLSLGIDEQLSPDEIKAISPPLVTVIAGINRALEYSFYGLEVPQELKKKTMLSMILSPIAFLWQWKRA